MRAGYRDVPRGRRFIYLCGRRTVRYGRRSRIEPMNLGTEAERGPPTIHLS